jgi:hypothetical protein
MTDITAIIDPTHHHFRSNSPSLTRTLTLALAVIFLLMIIFTVNLDPPILIRLDAL